MRKCNPIYGCTSSLFPHVLQPHTPLQHIPHALLLPVSLPHPLLSPRIPHLVVIELRPGIFLLTKTALQLHSRAHHMVARGDGQIGQIGTAPEWARVTLVGETGRRGKGHSCVFMRVHVC